MQEDNKGLMPELHNVRQLLTDRINDVPNDGSEFSLAGYKEGLSDARRLIEEGFNWSSRGGISGYVNNLDYDQICRLIEVAQELKAKKDEETKLWIHQVALESGGVRNFPQEQMQEAINCYHQELLRVATEEPGDIGAIRQVRLHHFKERESEYREYFPQTK